MILNFLDIIGITSIMDSLREHCQRVLAPKKAIIEVAPIKYKYRPKQ